MPTGRELSKKALLKLNYLDPASDPSGEDAEHALSVLNDMLSQWNAAKRYIPFTTFNQYTLIASHQPHTIGPDDADFDADVRPTKIARASVVVSGQGIPLKVLEEAEWAAETLKETTSELPIKLYYSPESPNGKIYLWPIPTVANELELQVAGILSSFATLDTSVNLAPGYELAIVLSLAEELTPEFGDLTPALVRNAARARAIITGNNVRSPKMVNDVRRGGGRYDIRIGRTRT